MKKNKLRVIELFQDNYENKNGTKVSISPHNKYAIIDMKTGITVCEINKNLRYDKEIGEIIVKLLDKINLNLEI